MYVVYTQRLVPARSYCYASGQAWQVFAEAPFSRRPLPDPAYAGGESFALILVGPSRVRRTRWIRRVRSATPRPPPAEPYVG